MIRRIATALVFTLGLLFLMATLDDVATRPTDEALLQAIEGA